MAMSRTLRSLLALLLVLGLVAAGCGRDEESSDDDGDQGTESPDDTGGEDGDQAAGPATTDACDGYEASPGVTDESITFGSSFPQSGLYAAFAEIAAGWQALTSLHDRAMRA